MSRLSPALVVLNGCFSIGKSTIAAALSDRLPMSCVVEPDTFAQFHPRNTSTGFNLHDYTWSMIFLIIGHALSCGVTCVVPVALVQGLTSTSVDMLLRRIEKLSAPTYYYHLSAPLDRVRNQNRLRADSQYPEDIVDKCWQMSVNAVEITGARIKLGNMDNRTEAPALIRGLMAEEIGLLPRSGAT